MTLFFLQAFIMFIVYQKSDNFITFEQAISFIVYKY